MPFTITAAAVDIAPGTYKGQLESVEVKPTENFGGGEYRQWNFLIEVDGKLLPVSATSSMNTGPRSKSYLWLTALLGRAPAAGETIEDPTGKTVLLTIGQKENGFPRIDGVSPFVEPAATVPGVPR